MNISVYQFAPHELETTLAVLDSAINNHRRWFDKLHTSMLCRQEFPDDILNECAHTHCAFGKWYYGDISESIRSFDEFHALESIHRHMHDNARALAKTCINEQTVSVENYQQFLNDQHKLIELLDSLHSQLIEQQHCFDALTGAVNRKSISLLLENSFENAQRYDLEYTVAMLDADNFKNINDTYGHLIGDHILTHICACLKKLLRKSDCIGRYGGEEFLILLTETDLQSAYEVMDKCRESLAQYPITIGKQEIHVSVSIGLAQLNNNDDDAWQTVDRADLALYQAKSTGRNRVVSHTE